MNFYIPTKIIQEENAVLKHGQELSSFGKKAILVTGKTSSKRNGSLDDVMKALTENGVEYVLYDRIEENPTVPMVMEGAVLGRNEGADFVIGIGGGSPMDAAKAIALMIQNRDSSSEVLFQSLPLKTLPLILIPTTCGTGSEATPYSILTRDDLQTKQSISHRIFPQLALVDAKYLSEIPKEILVDTVIDALGHLIESYFNTKADEYSRMLALRGMEIWSESRDVLLGMEPEPEQLEKMMLASTIAGMAISHTGTALPHGLSYYLTYHFKTPHGKAVGYFLPGYLSLFEQERDVETSIILRLLGFFSLEQFTGFLRECIGTLSLEENDYENMISQIMNAKHKLQAVPLEDVTREDICRIIDVLRERG